MQKEKDLEEKIAEANAEILLLKRELEIEAALEKVRGRTMAMKNSDELADAAAVLFQQLAVLGIEPAVCGFTILNRGNYTGDLYFSAKGKVFSQKTSFPHDLTQNTKKVYEEWAKGSDYYLSILEGEKQALENKKLDAYWQSKGVELFEDLTAFFDEHGIAEMRKKQIVHYAFFSHGFLHFSHYKPVGEIEILKRFAKVFDQTYTRFLDLQKAEAQAREAQIETALEKVRSATMAMRYTSELQKVINIVGQQFAGLNIENSGGVFICINDEIENEIIVWGSGATADYVQKVQLPFLDRPIYTDIVERLKKGPGFYVEEFSNKEKVDFLSYLFENPPYNKTSKEHQKKILAKKGGYTRSCAISKHTTLFMVSHDGHKFSTDEDDVLSRFGKVFEQTYTRFLDLKKAEEQAREAQIEVALERVRSRAVAMRHSDELSEAAELLYNEFVKLGVISFSCGYLINDDEKKEWKIWLTNPGEKFFKQYWTCPYFADHNLRARYESWETKEEFHCAILEGEENRAHHIAISEYAPWKSDMLDNLPPRLVFNSAHFSLGHLLVISPDRLTPELEQAMVRFAGVFDLAYRRFLDLQKAEAQANQLNLAFQENQRLLHSILPEQIAEQIRTGQKNVVKRFEQVSILFADIVGFTILSEKISPQKVVDILNGLFSKFDDLTDEYNLEKIKTIGDAYMVASGVPEEKADHAKTLFLFAQDMLRSLEEYNRANNSQLNIRVGISSGPVVAGVIGKKKFAYDLWGDSVNTAARMEAYGQEGKIQVSPASYELLKNDFSFEKLPDVEIKGKGVMDVYIWQS